MAARWMTWVGLCCSNRALVSAAFLGWEILGFSGAEAADQGGFQAKTHAVNSRQVGVSGGHKDPLLVRPSLSISHHLLDGSPHQAGATRHQDALGHQPRCLRHRQNPARNGGLSWGHLRVHPTTDHQAHPHSGMGTHKHQPHARASGITLGGGFYLLLPASASKSEKESGSSVFGGDVAWPGQQKLVSCSC